MTPTRLSATPWKRRTQFPLGFLGRTFQPWRSAPSGARTSKSSRVAPVTAKEASASRMRSGVSSRRMGWRNAGPESHPATAARSGGERKKKKTRRNKRGGLGAIPKKEEGGPGGRGVLPQVCKTARGGPPPRGFFIKDGVDLKKKK